MNATSNADAIVSVEHLSYRYAADRPVLDDVSLAVARGELFGFLGPNGSGKTTLFRLLATLIPAPPGTIRVAGFDAAVDYAAVRGRIGVVFQSPSVDKQLTALENLHCHGRLYGITGRELVERSREMLGRMNLLDRADDRVEDFSGGMRRRVELAKGLLTRPQVLLLDEPSTGLDPGARIDLWKTLAEVRAAGVTVLVTTHLMDEADRCDRLAVMAGGRVVACDAPAAMKADVGGDVITLSAVTPDRLHELATRLREALGVEPQTVDNTLRIERLRGHELVPQLIEAAPGLVGSVTVGKPTLEDVFIRLTGRRLADESDTATRSGTGAAKAVTTAAASA